MSKIIVIIAIVICALIAIALLWSLVKKLIENMNGKTAFIALIIMLVVVGALAFFAFAPRGQDSLFSSDVDGSEEGDGTEAADVIDGGHGIGIAPDSAQSSDTGVDGSNTVYVIVREDKISIGNRSFDGIETFEAAAASLKKDDSAICLVDDYAYAQTYKDAEAVLDKLGFEYTKETR